MLERRTPAELLHAAAVSGLQAVMSGPAVQVPGGSSASQSSCVVAESSSHVPVGSAQNAQPCAAHTAQSIKASTQDSATSSPLPGTPSGSLGAV